MQPTKATKKPKTHSLKQKETSATNKGDQETKKHTHSSKENSWPPTTKRDKTRALRQQLKTAIKRTVRHYTNNPISTPLPLKVTLTTRRLETFEEKAKMTFSSRLYDLHQRDGRPQDEHRKNDGHFKLSTKSTWPDSANR